jgi:thiamine biosynthesis protein ThiS
MGNTLKIIANGLETEIPEGTTVTQLLDVLEEPSKPDMIVEINRRFIHAKLYESTILNAGNSVEIIHLDIGG